MFSIHKCCFKTMIIPLKQLELYCILHQLYLKFVFNEKLNVSVIREDLSYDFIDNSNRDIQSCFTRFSFWHLSYNLLKSSWVIMILTTFLPLLRSSRPITFTNMHLFVKTFAYIMYQDVIEDYIVTVSSL